MNNTTFYGFDNITLDRWTKPGRLYRRKTLHTKRFGRLKRCHDRFADREKKFRDAATAKKPGKVADLDEAVSLLGQSALEPTGIRPRTWPPFLPPKLRNRRRWTD